MSLNTRVSLHAEGVIKLFVLRLKERKYTMYEMIKLFRCVDIRFLRKEKEIIRHFDG